MPGAASSRRRSSTATSTWIPFSPPERRGATPLARCSKGSRCGAELQPLLTHEAVKERAREYLRWCVAQGILYLRSHVDVCHDSLVGVRALVEVREELRGVIDVQLVAFPQHGFLRFPEAERLLDEALDLGVDVVGGIPHYERSREHGVESIRLLVERADTVGG